MFSLNLSPDWMNVALFLLGLVLISLGSCSMAFVNSVSSSVEPAQNNSAKQCNTGVIIIGIIFSLLFGYESYQKYIKS